MRCTCICIRCPKEFNKFSFIREISEPAKPVNGQDERRISCAAVNGSACFCQRGNQSGKALKNVFPPISFLREEQIVFKSGLIDGRIVRCVAEAVFLRPNAAQVSLVVRGIWLAMQMH